jgi:penicillin-binding protein 1A
VTDDIAVAIGLHIVDTISRKKATNCTPDSTKITIDVIVMTDPVTKKDKAQADGYDTENDDDVHKCTDVKPSASITVNGTDIEVTFSAGTFALKSYTLYVDGVQVSSGAVTGNTMTFPYPTYTTQPISLRITDEGGYEATVKKS